MSSRCLEDAFGRRLKHALRTFLQDSLKASWSRITKTNILVLIKTYSEEVWLGQICYVICYVSFTLIWREIALYMIIDTLVLIKTSWRRRKDVFWRRRWKTSSRRLQDFFIKTNVCWDKTKCMYFMIKAEKIFDKYIPICEKVNSIIKKVNSALIQNKKYLKAEKRCNTYTK